MEYKEYGHWSKDGKEYVITGRKTPRHWYNYMFNNSYVGFVSQVGFGDGFCQDKYSTRVKMITDRCLYITDKQHGTWHTANGLPIYAKYDRYECRHGLGYTTYIYEKDGIEGQLTVFVPVEGNFEQWIVTLTNKRETEADLSVIAYTATDVDGAYEKQGYNSMEGHLDSDTDALYHRFSTKFGTGQNTVNYTYMMSDAPVASYDCRHNAFIGTYGHKDAPRRLRSIWGVQIPIASWKSFALHWRPRAGLWQVKHELYVIRSGTSKIRRILPINAKILRRESRKSSLQRLLQRESRSVRVLRSVRPMKG